MLLFKQAEPIVARRQWMFQLIGQNIANEVPGGLKNSSNQTYTLAFLPNANTLVLTYNGQVLTGGGVDYTITGQTIVLTVVAPSASDVFLASYAVPALTGQTGSGYITKNGATAVATTNSMVEIDATNMPGFYYIALTAAELDTLGFIGLRVKTTNSLNFEDTAQISYNDPYTSQGGFVAPSNATGGITKSQSDDLLKKIKKMIAEEFAKYEEQEDTEEAVEQKDYTEKLDAIFTAVTQEEKIEEIEPVDFSPIFDAIAAIEKPQDFTPHFKALAGQLERVVPLVSENAQAFEGKMSVATESINSSLDQVKEIATGFAELKIQMDEFKTTLAEQSDMDKRFDAMSSGKNDKKMEGLTQKFTDLQEMIINAKYDILKELTKVQQ